MEQDTHEQTQFVRKEYDKPVSFIITIEGLRSEYRHYLDTYFTKEIRPVEIEGNTIL